MDSFTTHYPMILGIDCDRKPLNFVSFNSDPSWLLVIKIEML